MSVNQFIRSDSLPGIGLAIVTSLLKNPPVQPIDIIACARNIPDPSPTPRPSTGARLSWPALDISSQHSIDAFVSSIKRSRPQGIDVLINNAGINLDNDNPPGFSVSRQTLSTNYHGTIGLTQAILPLMTSPSSTANKHDDSDQRSRPEKRVVTISSVGSKGTPSHQKRRLVRCSKLDEIAAIGDEYLSFVAHSTNSDFTTDNKNDETNDLHKNDWPIGKSYSVSKSMLNAAMKVISDDHQGSHIDTDTKVAVNTCCPGWCATDMGRQVGRSPAKTTEQGARIPLRLAFGDIGGVSGCYWENPSVTDTGDGEPVDWTV